MRPDVIRMANHIARQFDHLSDAEARVALATHLTSFWAPEMRRDLLTCVVQQPSVLHPRVVEVADDLRSRLG